MLAYDDGAAALIVWTGSAWVTLMSLLAQLAVTTIGIGTAPDAGNPLAASLNNALFNALATTYGGSGDVRVKLSKQATANTASFLFQDAFSGRAEFGLTGDDNFTVKVSPDGSTWHTAISIDAATGRVSFPSGTA